MKCNQYAITCYKWGCKWTWGAITEKSRKMDKMVFGELNLHFLAKTIMLVLACVEPTSTKLSKMFQFKFHFSCYRRVVYLTNFFVHRHGSYLRDSAITIEIVHPESEGQFIPSAVRGGLLQGGGQVVPTAFVLHRAEDHYRTQETPAMFTRYSHTFHRNCVKNTECVYWSVYNVMGSKQAQRL